MPVHWNSRHDHIFGQDQPTAGERRTVVVVAITAVAMVVEIAAGMMTGSMALLADGLHMASHAVALGIAAFAYRYARKHAADPRFSFGTGKVNALAGYSGAVLLGVFALGMAFESTQRLFNPIDIAVDQALIVAIIGLLVNGASVFILGVQHQHSGHHHHQEHEHEHHHDHKHDHDDHNLKSAYFHVLADALTSVLAIGALLSAKYYGQYWLDPVMGIVGAVLVAKWSVGLLKESGNVLVDRQAAAPLLEAVRKAFESQTDTTVADLHIWSIGPGRNAAIISLQSKTPLSLEAYRKMVPDSLGIHHLTIEISGALQ